MYSFYALSLSRLGKLLEQSTHLFICLSPRLQNGKKAKNFRGVAKMHLTEITEWIMTNNVSYYNIFTITSTHTHSSGFVIIEQDESFPLLRLNKSKH